MTRVHLIELGDPRTDEAWCHGCSWKAHNSNRYQLLAASYRHLADSLDPPEPSKEMNV